MKAEAVEAILALHRHLVGANSAAQKAIIQRQIGAADTATAWRSRHNHHPAATNHQTRRALLAPAERALRACALC
jgi:hypothetical protein